MLAKLSFWQLKQGTFFYNFSKKSAKQVCHIRQL